MLDAVRDRLENIGVRCFNCQKKLVANEKMLCKECQETGKLALIAGTIAVGTDWAAAKKSHNKDDED